MKDSLKIHSDSNDKKMAGLRIAERLSTQRTLTDEAVEDFKKGSSYSQLAQTYFPKEVEISKTVVKSAVKIFLSRWFEEQGKTEEFLAITQEHVKRRGQELRDPEFREKLREGIIRGNTGESGKRKNKAMIEAQGKQMIGDEEILLLAELYDSNILQTGRHKGGRNMEKIIEQFNTTPGHPIRTESAIKSMFTNKNTMSRIEAARESLRQGNNKLI